MKHIANLIVIIAALSAAESAPAQSAPDFDRDVATLFSRRCFDCHNPVEQRGKLDLTRREPAMKGGKDGAIVVPGNLDQSLLWKRISENDMPPKHPLADAEKQILRQWIVSGAKWGTDTIDPFRFTTAKRAGYDWWALQPVKRVDPPRVKQADWVRNPIDTFVLAELERQGLSPSPQADRRTLIRRVTFDLIGLPPTPKQVADFVKDDSPDAYEKLVDRLLASPDYGVRWARHWLDTIRFGESNGFERDQLRTNAWRYRDWVVDSLNADLPYDQFTRMQLAGDLMEPQSAAGTIATGFLVAGAYDQVGDTQQSLPMRKVVQQDQLEDIVGTVAQTFLGLTANCARCHDHKFDPILQKEYYQLASALSGSHHGEREIPASAARAAAVQFGPAIDARLAAIQAELDAIETPAKNRLLAARKTQAAAAAETLRKIAPIAEWRFDQDLRDHIGNLHATAQGAAAVGDGALQLPGKGSFAATTALPIDVTEKTLEAWVSLRDIHQRGGAAISLQTRDGSTFDAIVFGEREPGRWMAGSDSYKRYQSFEGPQEKQTTADFVQVAITWQADGTITGYRNGQLYGRPYRSSKPVTFRAGSAQILIGLRHFPAEAGKVLTGAVHKARLYNRALSAQEIAAAAGVEAGISDAELAAAVPSELRAHRDELRFELRALRAQQTRATATKTYACAPIAPAITHLLYRGNPARPGPIVSPAGIASIIGPVADFGLKPDAPDADRRQKLAAWITDARNPLFARVIANRLWQYHFGAGIVDTPNDFGFNGSRPTHPQLLDWLAAEVAHPTPSARDGASPPTWSLKHLHRLMVLSATYRQASLVRPDAMQADASNRLLWRMNPRRIEAEALRDAVLQVAGELNPQLGGPGYEDYYTFTQNSTFYEARDYIGPTFNRRSLYRTWARSGRNPLLDVFDCPDPSTKTPRRAITTTPLQALALMNDSFILRMSDALAQAVKRESGEEVEKQVNCVYERTLCRRPAADENADAAEFVKKHGLAGLCRVMFNSSEFVSVD